MHLPNVHLYHYSNLKADIRAQITDYAAAIGASPDPDLVDRIAEATGIDRMREVARRHDKSDSSRVFNDPATFFDSGSMNKSGGRLTRDQIDTYARRMSGLQPEEDRIWLETGQRP